MMKTVLFLLVAGAFAANPPRIELDMSQMAGAKLEQSIFRDHNDGLRQPNGDKVQSRQDWTERCSAGPDTDVSICPFPVAKAWDHQDEDISSKIRTRVYLVDVDGHKCGTAEYDCGCDKVPGKENTQCQVSTVNFARRSTYLFKYDVTDSAGNHAEQVVFALILDDSCGEKCNPKITTCGPDAESWEAAGPDKLCSASVTATDNIDTPDYMMSHLKYNIDKLDEASASVESLCKDESFLEYQTTGEGCAKRELDTKKVGRYLVTLHVCDNAGVYGSSSKSNCVAQRKAIVIRDTEPPIIKIHGAQPTFKECHYKKRESDHCSTKNEDGQWVLDPTKTDCHMYQDEGAKVEDALDTIALGKNLDKPCAGGVHRGCLERGFDGPPVDSSKPDTYKVTYDAWDYAGKKATQKIRQVVVRDLQAPKITLNGPNKIIHYSNKEHDANSEVSIEDPGASCDDDCDRPVGGIKATASWQGGIALDDSKIGDYVRIYKCTDNANHVSETRRTYSVVDQGVPEIQVMGPENITLPASRTLEYTDQGATCEDYVDGTLSHAVEVSGQVVNMRIPGKYTIYYDCQDLSGNAAPQMKRVVTIKDNSCPTITLNCDNGGSKESPCATQPAPVVYVEAGFTYVDAGAIATDDLDGDISNSIYTVGNDVNDRQVFYSRRSCAEIKRHYSGATSGDYYITTYVEEPEAKFTRQLVHCDMDSLDANANAVGFTYQVCNGCKAVKPYSDASGDCPARGLEMVRWTENNKDSKEELMKDPDFAPYFPEDTVPSDELITDMYLCGTNDETVAAAKGHELTTNTISHDKIEKAEAGKYIIKYHVQDSSGNRECTPVQRTVIVKDTLPPVITLHLANKLIHTGSGGSSSPETGARDNPADGSDNPHLASDFTPTETAWAEAKNGKWQGRRLMAEEPATGANMWLVGGVASAIAGLALLGLSRRHMAVETVEV